MLHKTVVPSLLNGLEGLQSMKKNGAPNKICCIIALLDKRSPGMFNLIHQSGNFFPHGYSRYIKNVTFCTLLGKWSFVLPGCFLVDVWEVNVDFIEIRGFHWNMWTSCFSGFKLGNLLKYVDFHTKNTSTVIKCGLSYKTQIDDILFCFLTDLVEVFWNNPKCFSFIPYSFLW